MSEQSAAAAGASLLREFRAADAAALRRVALAAFEQFERRYSDWTAVVAAISRMPDLAERGEIIVAEIDGRVVGGVVYIPVGKPKADYFERSWPIIRMLVVDPVARGQGIGHALTQECLRRARRDGSPIFGLHTTPIMTVALPMYLRIGFKHRRDVPPIHGVLYAVYTMEL
jgi:predicted N-acetyltransferase YhbS